MKKRNILAGTAAVLVLVFLVVVIAVNHRLQRQNEYLQDLKTQTTDLSSSTDQKEEENQGAGAGTGPGNLFLVRKQGSQSGIDGSAGPLFLGGTKCKSSGQRNHQLSRFFPTGSELSSAGLYGLPGWGK